MMDAPIVQLANEMPAGSFIDRWVLEQPWPMALGLVGAAIAAVFVMSRRDEFRKGLVAGAGLALAGVIVLLTGLFITTTREHLYARGRAFVNAVVAGDSTAVGELLGTNVELAARGSPATDDGRALIQSVTEASDALGITNISYSPIGGVVDGPSLAQTRFVLRVSSSHRPYQGYPMTMTWNAGWTRAADGTWRIKSLDLVEFSDAVPSPELFRNWRSYTGRGLR